MNIQAAYLIFNGCEEFPINIVKAYFYYILSLLVLFANFYIKDNYLTKKKTSSKSLSVDKKIESKEEDSNTIGTQRSTRSRSRRSTKNSY